MHFRQLRVVGVRLQHVLEEDLISVGDIHQRDSVREPKPVPAPRMGRVVLGLSMNVFAERVFFAFRLDDRDGLVIHEKQIVALGVSLHQGFLDGRGALRDVLVPGDNVPAGSGQLLVDLDPGFFFRQHGLAFCHVLTGGKFGEGESLEEMAHGWARRDGVYHSSWKSARGICGRQADGDWPTGRRGDLGQVGGSANRQVVGPCVNHGAKDSSKSVPPDAKTGRARKLHFQIPRPKFFMRSGAKVVYLDFEP